MSLMYFNLRTLSLFCCLLTALLSAHPSRAATIIITTNVLGPTPKLLAYNSGHFFTNSNTRDWWRYAGVNGARVFLSPAEIEPSDDISPVGDGVNSQATFLARKAAVRADPLNLSYINWAGSSYFSNRYENNDLYPNNHIRPNYTFRELRKLGISICAQITASQSRFPLSGPTDWPNMWEIWQHYYAQGFYLARAFDVERYQMFNEPNHSNAGGLTLTNFLIRLQLASDAIQSAIADVNSMYGKTLSPNILAPVTAGSADSSYAGWGEIVVTNRHKNYLGQIDSNFWLIHTYDYHQYGSSPSGFGSDLVNLNNFLTSDMAPEPRFPTAISEFNTDTGADFDDQVDTLDSPTKYPRFGSICVNLLANNLQEFYAFKFSQTSYASTNYPVQKNAMHYVDNTNAPYNIGGITKAGEVYRLFNKAFAAGRDRVVSSKDSGAAALDVHASYDAARNRFHLFSVNNTASDVSLNFNCAALPVSIGNLVLLEEVSETAHGAGHLWTNMPSSKIVSVGTQRARTVWLLTVFAGAQSPEQLLTATDDAEVRDGSNKSSNYGTGAYLAIRNDPVTAANRSAAFLKFDLAGINTAAIEAATLAFRAGTTVASATAQAHLYGLDTNSWTEESITWANAPNLKQNVPAGNTILRQFLAGAGDSAYLLGQVVASTTNFSGKWIDVTDFLRTRTNAAASFLVIQEPRWDVTLPSLEVGDTQPDGIRILAAESGNGPVLRLRLRPAPPTNSPPAALNDAVTTPQGAPVIISPLANDSDPNDDPLSIAAFTQAANGTVSSNSNSTLIYTPTPAFSGADTFSYTVTDGQGGTNTASVSITVSASGGPPYWTNLPALGEAFVRGGVNAATDPDEVATDYLMVKYNAPSLDNARKAYFQFDLAGLSVNTATQALFTIRFTNSYKQNIQLWALDQPYATFNSSITWNSAQANNTTNNSLLTNGLMAATPIGAVTNIPGSGTTPHTFAIPAFGTFVHSNRLTLVLSGAPDAGVFTNNASGLRLLRTNATLQVLVTPPQPPAPELAPVISSIVTNPDDTITLGFIGATNHIHYVEATTNLALASWLRISTNLSDATGHWVFSEPFTNFSRRFYRAVVP